MHIHDMHAHTDTNNTQSQAQAQSQAVPEACVPSPKTPEEQRGGCARTLGQSLIDRYHQQRRENLSVRRENINTVTLAPVNQGLKAYVGDERKSAVTDSGGSVASRGSRREHRLFNSAAAEFGKAKGVPMGDALNFNELMWRQKKLKFAKSAIHAWGLYALEPIEKEDFVVEYMGEYIRNPVAEARQKRYERQGFDDDYIFRVDADLLVDATRRGGLARFANHCCDPNCYSRIIQKGGKQRIALYSKRAIDAGEEITYDYKFDRDEDESKRIPCRCGAVRCFGFLN